MSRMLDRVNTPDDLKDLCVSELEQLAEEIRMMIIGAVSSTGGHLAANLGVVELTIALLKTFDPPDDKIVWDVGHQSYTYKILTGRKDRFSTIRQEGGLAGFCKRTESKYDAFGAGHAGTALSAAMGMAFARDRRGGDENVVVVSGDASISNGISLEALNNLAGATERLVVILNDNEMSISENVGSMSSYLGKLLSNPRYNRWKKGVEQAAKKAHLDWLRSVYYRLEEAVKSLFLKSVIFEEFGLRYIGPIDGHNIHSLLDALTVARESDKPIIVHVSTQKGKGYAFAENQPGKWHGTPGFDIASGEHKSKGSTPGYSSIFGDVITDLAEKDNRIVAITAAMRDGTGLAGFADKYPGRFFDVGMSEEHAVVFAAGLATEGLLPVVAVYSTFMQRSVDCIVHDVCLQDLHVVMCLDRAGIVGDDGPTHHGVFDVAMLRPIPGLVIMQPKDEAELADMLYSATQYCKPVVVRYPRGAGTGAKVPADYTEVPFGKAEVVRGNENAADVAIWAIGDMIPVAEEAAKIIEKDGCSVTVVNPRFIKPLDEEMLKSQAAKARVIVTIENSVVTGGFGSGVEELLVEEGFKGRIIKVGWPDEFIPHGNVGNLMKKYGLSAESVAEEVKKVL